jgi:hypothetical protein
MYCQDFVTPKRVFNVKQITELLTIQLSFDFLESKRNISAYV